MRLACLITLICISLAGCQSSGRPGVEQGGPFSVTINGSRLAISAGGRGNTIDLADQLAGSPVLSSGVVYSASNQSGIYLLIDFVSRSQAGADCQNGTEENLIWVALDRSLSPINRTCVLIASCSQGITVAGIRQNDRSIVVACDSANPPGRRFYFFRKKAPEQGLTTTSTEPQE